MIPRSSRQPVVDSLIFRPVITAAQVALHSQTAILKSTNGIPWPLSKLLPAGITRSLQGWLIRITFGCANAPNTSRVPSSREFGLTKNRGHQSFHRG